MTLRAARSTEGALDLLRALGYDTSKAKPYDLSDVGMDGVEGLRLRSSQSRSYGILVAEVETMPASLKSFGRRLLDNFHDRPLAILGEARSGTWQSFAVVRPRLVKGGGGAVTIARLVVRPSAPTAHDVEVVSGLEWDSGMPDPDNHAAIDGALDVERVTRRFFVELNGHYERIASALAAAAASDVAVHAGIERAGGARRVGLRIVTQTLFCYFLQRKGLLENEPGWLSSSFRAQLRDPEPFYGSVMEPLFYEALARPIDERPEAWRREGLPFLNGGLFERRYGEVSLPLPDELFSTEDGLLGFLNGWSFTVAEERADESEVAVDPEMLGKVFENLMSKEDRRNQGTVYTPRPVVQFMCREALVPYLQRKVAIIEAEARLLIDGDDPFGALAEKAGTARAAKVAAGVDTALEEIKVLDPAVGSGAFPLGMLAEIMRLRRDATAVLTGSEPDASTARAWRVHAIEHSLFGVDIDPAAIELCRLRLWLALLVDAPDGKAPDPLPNLEYRTVVAGSLSDFVAGVEVQNTRDAVALDIEQINPAELLELRERYFATTRPDAKAELRERIAAAEDEFLSSVFDTALERAKNDGEEAVAAVEGLVARFRGLDRVFPALMPAFHAPDAAADGGWDVVIMNPPYLSRKEAKQRLDPVALRDLELHYGRTADLMVHFAWRALQLVCEGGVLSMIFNDSIFTSTDAVELRRTLLAGEEAAETVHVAARTKCFEGVAVNGGVIVASRAFEHDPEIRWVENHGRPTNDLLAAGRIADPTRAFTAIGQSELFEVPSKHYHRLPHRPLFRPSRPALEILKRYRSCKGWAEFSRYTAPGRQASWELLSNTHGLNGWIEEARRVGWYDSLEPGKDFVLLGLVVEGGQGLATADDRRFLGVLEGTDEATKAEEMRDRLEALTLAHPEAGARYRELRREGLDRADALVTVADEWHPIDDLDWPKSGLVRTVDPGEMRHRALSGDEVRDGISAGPTWVPFEKGDSSGEGGGGALWTRENPIAIDWSPELVKLLRKRAASGESYRRPRLQNEHLWGQGGVTWNRVASYLRARRVPEAGIFSDKTPTLSANVSWLSDEAVLALLNSDPLDFLMRTFLGSRMQIEIGDVRRLPIPVLDERQGSELTEIARQALRDPSRSVAAELDAIVRPLYGLDHNADLWVVR